MIITTGRNPSTQNINRKPLADNPMSITQTIREYALKKPFIRNYLRMAPYILPYRWRIIGGLSLSFPIGLMNATICGTIKPFTDQASAGSNTDNYSIILPMIIVSFGVMQGLCTFAATYLNSWACRKILNDVRLTLFKKLSEKDASFFDQKTSGAIQRQFNEDAEKACNGLIQEAQSVVTRSITSLSLIVCLLLNSLTLSAIALLTLVVTFIPLQRLRGKISVLEGSEILVQGAVNTKYVESYNGNRVVASFCLARHQTNKFDELQKRKFKIAMKNVKRVGIISPMMHTITSVGIALVICLGLHLVKIKQISTGNLASFVVALAMLYEPMKTIGNTFKSLFKSMNSLERVWNSLNDDPVIKNSENPKKFNTTHSTISFRNVSFSYHPEQKILNNINVSIQSGQTIAIVGKSGGGKTTLSSLLTRFYDVTDGGIFIDNTDIREIDLESLRKNISMVFQDNFLFSGTIRDNIVLDKQSVSDIELSSVLKAACLMDFINSLENGVDTQVGERGILLSGGQRQRVGIARAFMKNAPIVILDEATSSLDNQSEIIVQKAVQNLMKNRTVIIIAHRLSTIRHADRILVFDKGLIAEQGTHAELMDKPNGMYASLYNQDPVIASFA